MNTTIKITGVTLQIALFCGIIFLFLTFLSARFSVFGLRSFTVVTGSMEPKLKVGSVIFTKPVSEYKIGNIITFNRGGVSVTHRIAELKNGGFVTKGDANSAADNQIVYKNAIVGKNLIAVPYLGKAINFFRTPLGFLTFVFIPIAIYIVLEARVFKREWEKEVERKVLQKHNITEVIS